MNPRVTVTPGDGLVMARDQVLLVVLSPSTDAEGTTKILDLARAAPGEELLRELSRLVMHAEALPAFATLTGTLESATLLLHGDVEFVAWVEGMPVSGRGGGPREWVERTLPGVAEWIGIGRSVGEPPDTAWFDLEEGTTPGEAAWLIGQGTPPPPPPESAVLVDFTDTGPTEERSPLPPAATQVAERGGSADPTATQDAPPEHEVIVRGVRCPDDHHNNPLASYCSTCGRRMGVSRSLILVDGPRPPLGVLILDDGATVPVRCDMVLGRSPLEHPLVVSGDADGVEIADAAQSISRVHLLVHLDEWDVFVTDLGSSNGTFAWDEESQTWQALEPQISARVEGRQRLRLGDREMLFAQHHIRAE